MDGGNLQRSKPNVHKLKMTWWHGKSLFLLLKKQWRCWIFTELTFKNHVATNEAKAFTERLMGKKNPHVFSIAGVDIFPSVQHSLAVFTVCFCQIWQERLFFTAKLKWASGFVSFKELSWDNETAGVLSTKSAVCWGQWWFYMFYICFK